MTLAQYVMGKNRAFPYFVVLLLTSLLFTLSLMHPYQVDADTAFQVKSVQQWLAGQATQFNSVVLPDAADLARDVQTWTVWWPPGVPAATLPLIALGVPIGLATRITAFLLFCLGCLGWLRLADWFQVRAATRYVLAVTLPLYAATIASLMGFVGDVIPFGIVPWLMLYTLNCCRSTQANLEPHKQVGYGRCWLNFTILGLLLGGLYWIKYSAFTVSLASICFVGIHLLWMSDRFSLVKRLALAAGCGVSMLIPFMGLSLLNKTLGGVAVSATQYDTMQFTTPATQGLGLLLSAGGAMGLGLFQSSIWLMHFTHFSDSWLPFFRSLTLAEREIPLAALGIPGTLVVISLLVVAWSQALVPQPEHTKTNHQTSVASRTAALAIGSNPVILFINQKLQAIRKNPRLQHLIFCYFITLIPFVIFGYLTAKSGFNFLVNNVRYVSAFFIVTQIFLLETFWDLLHQHHKTLKQVFLLSLILPFYLAPNLFIGLNFLKNEVIEWQGRQYITTQNRMYVSALSETNVNSVMQDIDAVVTSNQDVIVLALDEQAPFGTWIEMGDHRTLPLVDAWGPLVNTHGTEGANLRADSKLTTSEAIRLHLVISKSIVDDREFFDRLKSRFPQAEAWTLSPEIAKNPDSKVLIFSTLLSA